MGGPPARSCRFLKDNSHWLVKFPQGVRVAAGILATYALATKIIEIGAAVEGLTAVLALNPCAWFITGVGESLAAFDRILHDSSSSGRNPQIQTTESLPESIVW